MSESPSSLYIFPLSTMHTYMNEVIGKKNVLKYPQSDQEIESTAKVPFVQVLEAWNMPSFKKRKEYSCILVLHVMLMSHFQANSVNY